MQTDNKFIDDMAKVASNALGVLAGVRDEFEATFRARLERWLADMDLVTRDEFEAVKAMAQKARVENQALEKRLAALDGKAVKPQAKPAATARAKPTAKAAPKAKAKPAAKPAAKRKPAPKTK